jgi:glycosyltransferase involved in cell wall biosynthesis
MKMLFFDTDLFDEGGIPAEFQGLLSVLGEGEHDVVAVSVSNKPESLNQCVVHTASNVCKALGVVWKELRQGEINVVVSAGYFNPFGMVAGLMAKVLRVKFVLYPVNQINWYVLSNDLFSENPDVKVLESGSPENKKSRPAGLNVFLKKVYRYTLGWMIIRLSDGVAVLSDYEKNEIKTIYPLYPGSFIELSWFVSTLPLEERTSDFYNERYGESFQKKPVVYWGRQDYKMKGLDRLLAGVEWARKYEGELPFHLFIIGPGYQGGEQLVRRDVENRDLGGCVTILLPGEYQRGDISPLRDASMSVLLSRWDGIPRALRESLALGVPVLASKETHFGSVIQESGAGIILEDADDPASVGEALLEMAYSSEKYRPDSPFAYMDRTRVTHRFWGQLEYFLNS